MHLHQMPREELSKAFNQTAPRLGMQILGSAARKLLAAVRGKRHVLIKQQPLHSASVFAGFGAFVLTSSRACVAP